jgi:primase-polymerase (primpol)-like protein
MLSLPEALAPLAAYKQFILWTIAERNGKQVKLPVDFRTMGVGDAHDSDAWLTAEDALAIATHYGSTYGIGFVFTENDPFFFVDIDKCLEPDGQTWSPVAVDIMNRLPGAAIEVSQSGRGLHIFGTGVCPDHCCRNIPLGLEFYTEGRFVALTGTSALGSAAFDCSAVLPDLVNNYFPPKEATKNQEWTYEPVIEWNGLEDDAELIEKILSSKTSARNAFGGGVTFAQLWTRDETALGEAFPHPDENRPYDNSMADASLAQHLAFWTGKDCERIVRLMKMSALVREKWDRKDYLIRTTLRAVSLQKDVYSKPTPVEQAAPPMGVVNQGPQVVSGYQFLAATQQLEHFKGCVYVQDIHRVFTPSGSLLKSEQINATYGGYTFALDDQTSGKTTRKAFEAFTESQLVKYPKAESMCFRPLSAPGQLIQEDGRQLINTYIPVTTPAKTGDPKPFLDHLRKVLPNKQDRQILLCYMAACVQHKGVKFQWAPLLQGCEGNGKTLFTRCVVRALGEKYSHLPLANEIAEKFNEWLFNKLFIGIEDVYVPDHKQEIIEVLKPMITNKRLAMRAMQRSQVMGDNYANFILNSNHKSGIRKTRNDRRFAVFFSAQQNEEDLIRDGMGGSYFPKLYKWLDDNDGYAIVTDYLTKYEIPDELNPATSCHRAPETSSTLEAINAGLGGIEQEILEAVEEGRTGFAGGWISSVAVERLLYSIHAARVIPHNKRRELLKSLGYDWHPALKDGRVNNPISIDDGKKPRLFIQENHIHKNLESPTEVVRLYQEAQGVPTPTGGKYPDEIYRTH